MPKRYRRERTNAEALPSGEDKCRSVGLCAIVPYNLRLRSRHGQK
jgi:hypothetical protein